MFLTSLLITLIYIRAEINADQLRTIFARLLPSKLDGFCTKIFQIFLPNNRPPKNNCALVRGVKVACLFFLRLSRASHNSPRMHRSHEKKRRKKKKQLKWGTSVWGVKVVSFSPSHMAVHGVSTSYHLSKYTYRVLDQIWCTYLFET